MKAAGLVETLSGKGPFTVFAPTNDAFAKVPKEALDDLLADKDKLTKVWLTDLSIDWSIDWLIDWFNFVYFTIISQHRDKL